MRIRIQQLKLMRIHVDPDPDPKPCWRVCPPFGSGGEGAHSGEGWGSPNSDEGTYTAVLYINIRTLWGQVFFYNACIFSVQAGQYLDGEYGRDRVQQHAVPHLRLAAL